MGGVFNGTLYQPTWLLDQPPRLNFTRNFHLEDQDKPGNKTFTLPANLNPENLKISLDRSTKTLSISADHEEKTTNENNEVIASSTQKFSYKFIFPENVKLESVKSHFDAETGKLSVSWEAENAIDDGVRKLQIQMAE